MTWTVVAIMGVMTVCVVVLIGYVAYTDIALLFDPRSFAESVQQRIYVGRARDRTLIAPPQNLVSIVSTGSSEAGPTEPAAKE